MPSLRKYGIKDRYKVRVESDELSKIRKNLNGLKRGPNDGKMEEWRA